MYDNVYPLTQISTYIIKKQVFVQVNTNSDINVTNQQAWAASSSKMISFTLINLA